MERLQSPILTSNLKAIRQKLFQAFPQEQRRTVSNIRKRILIGDNASANVASLCATPLPQISVDIAESFLRQHCLKIEYQSESGEQTLRVIEAQYILLDWPTWYIIAWDHLRMSSRMFRIDRIKNTRAVGGAFRLRPQHLFIDKFAPYFKAI